MGAGRLRLVRQLLTEAIALAALGGIVGLILAIWAARLLVAFLSTGHQALVLNVNPDLRVLTFTLAISLVTAIVFGLAPALRVTSLDLSGSNAGQSRDSFQHLPVKGGQALSPIAGTHRIECDEQ